MCYLLGNLILPWWGGEVLKKENDTGGRGGGGGVEALSRGPTPYPFIYHFGQKRYPFHILLIPFIYLFIFFIYFFFAIQNVKREKEKKYNTEQKWSGSLKWKPQGLHVIT